MKEMFTYSLLVLTFLLSAQEEKKEVDKILPKGNEAFQDKKYDQAEVDYRISQSKGISGTKATYNLGNAIYKQKNPSESKNAYLKVIENSTSKDEKHKSYHNLGNVLMGEKDYSAAVEAYKNALRNNPSDEKTRYNYALAKELLKKNPPKGGGNDDKDKNKDDQNKQKEKEQQPEQDKDQKKENKDKGDQKDKDPKDGNDQKGNEKEGDQNPPPKPNPSGISKDRMENILDAVNNEEKKVQDKMNLQKVKGKPVKTEKDW